MYLFFLEKSRGGASEERRREHGSNLARLETASEIKKLLTLNLSSRRRYKLQAKISGHAVDDFDGLFCWTESVCVRVRMCFYSS